MEEYERQKIESYFETISSLIAKIEVAREA